MKRIIIVRHGESIGNAENIIQGRKYDYGLTEKGRAITGSNLQSNLDEFCDVTRVISSPAIRAQETATIIADELGVPVFINNNLVEIDAGILDGMDKIVAERTYPKYYKAWKNREDLDTIPEAEPGEKLQARAIGFLMQYYDQPDYCDVVVSHAGFIRCLINTIENRKRDFKVDIENSSIFVIDDMLENLEVKKRDRAMNSKVFIINTANGKYVAKIKSGKVTKQDCIEQALLNKLPSNNLPRVLYLQNYSDDRYCKVIKYVNGKHIYGRLPDDEYNALIESERLLRNELTKFKGINFFRIRDLKKELQRIYTSTTNEYIKELSKKLMESPYLKDLDDINSYVLSHNDLNRDNILFEEDENGEVKANIIDFESLEFAPQDFQFASMLASGLLLEGEHIDKIKQTIIQER